MKEGGRRNEREGSRTGRSKGGREEGGREKEQREVASNNGVCHGNMSVATVSV